MPEPVTDNTYYFAYGCNLSSAQMEKRCPSAVTIGRAKLAGFKLVFPRKGSNWPGGVAGIERDGNSNIEGVVYELSPTDFATLDHFEGVTHHRYERTQVTPVLDDGSALDAIAYVATRETDQHLMPSREYLDTMIRGARENELSATYIATLEAMEVQ